MRPNHNIVPATVLRKWRRQGAIRWDDLSFKHDRQVAIGDLLAGFGLKSREKLYGRIYNRLDRNLVQVNPEGQWPKLFSWEKLKEVLAEERTTAELEAVLNKPRRPRSRLKLFPLLDFILAALLLLCILYWIVLDPPLATNDSYFKSMPILNDVPTGMDR